MNQMKSRNYPLLVGIVLAGIILFFAIFGSRLAPHEPMEVFNELIRQGDEVFSPSRQPVPPLRLDLFLLGTDNAGRDLYSRLLWAIRPTMLLCLIIAFSRIVLGVVLGLVAGWFGGTTRRVIDTLISISLAVPILLFALALILFIGDRELSTFMLALVATGWAGTALYVKNSTEIIKEAPYIDGARAIGVPSFGILRNHVFPQLWPTLPALISFELAATLLVIAELGFMGLFIGEAFIIMAEDPASGGVIPVGLTAHFAELGQMASDFWSKMLRSPWELAIVGLVIFLIIFTFNILGEGLRRHMDITRPRPSWWRRRRDKDLSVVELD
jgi:peptide/nickel transport system permease protein